MSFSSRFSHIIRLKFLSAAAKKKLWLAFKVCLIAGISLAVVGVLAFTLFAAWVSRDLPDPNTLSTREIPQSTKIFDRTGKNLLYEIHGDERRTLVKIEDIPDYAKHATIAIEDKRFYEHHGVYWQGLIRAVILNTLRGQRISGTSTLTQQLVKNAILTNERSLLRKVKEFILAMQIEREYSKDQILQLYLNEIPYGSTIYGIESASQSYFGKHAKELSLDEAALLAAIPQAPDLYNPYGTGSRGDNRQRLVVRQHYILDLMAEQGYVTKEAADQAKEVDSLKKLRPKTFGDITAPHFVMYVRSLLVEKYGQKMVEQGGLNVVTTLSVDMQKIAEEEVKNGVEDPAKKKFKFSNAALVAVDPKTGQIQAMVGSKDFFDKEIDGQVNVTLSPRQPGSSFKPIVYAAAFAKGYLPETEVWDVLTNFRIDGRDYEPKNYNGKESGPVSLRKALQGSLNIPAVKAMYLVGVGRAIDFAESLGYTTFADRGRFGLAVVLGGGEVKPLEHAMAYAAFANEGIRYPSSAILKVTGPDGVVMEEWKQPDGERVMEQQTARLTSDVLSDNQSRAYVFGLNNSLVLKDRPVAAKTGTTNNNKDAWTAGYTPNLVSVVWVGNSNGKEMAAGADGSIIAAPIWQKFMNRATQSIKVERFNKPEAPKTTKLSLLGKVTRQKIRIDRVSGKRATEFTPPEFIEEREFLIPHDILHYVDRDDPLGPEPSNPAMDPMYRGWEASIASWVQRAPGMATSTPPTEYDDIHTANSKPLVSISSPTDNQILSSRDLIIQPMLSGARRIVRVEATMNGQPFGTAIAEPWTIQGRIPSSLGKGYYELVVTAVDDAGNRGQAKHTVNLQAETEVIQGGLSILSPFNEVVWSRGQFPERVQIELAQPTAYRKIEVSFVGDDGQKRTAHVESNPSYTTLSISIPLGPPAGRYRLLVAGEQVDGRVDQDSVFITITD